MNAPEDLLDDVWLAELSQLMPELRARYPDLPLPLMGDAHFVRARLFEAMALLGSALAARRPAVLALDDMQWADTDTLDLVHYLARRWKEIGAPILLLLAVRQEAYAAEAGLREWLAGLERDVPLTRSVAGQPERRGYSTACRPPGRGGCGTDDGLHRVGLCGLAVVRDPRACPFSSRPCCKCWSSKVSYL